MSQQFAGGSVPGLFTETYVSFLMTDLSNYNKIFETETWYFWGNMKVLLGHLCIRWTSEGVDIKHKMHHPFKWIQLIDWSNFLNISNGLDLSNELKECSKFWGICLWNLCFISMKEFIFIATSLNWTTS